METARERRVSRIVARLMTAAIDAYDIPGPAGPSLMDHWRRHGMLEPDDRPPDRFTLTGAGSWFIRAMIQEFPEVPGGAENP
jgi:hypothetical protein